MEERASLNPSPGMLSLRNHCIRTYTFANIQLIDDNRFRTLGSYFSILREVSIEAILSTLIYSILCQDLTLQIHRNQHPQTNFLPFLP